MSKFLQIVALVLFTVFLFPIPVRAGDCSGPDDCGAVPDNGTRAAIGGGIVAGILLYGRSRRARNGKAEEEPPENTDARFGTADPEGSGK